MLSLSEFSLLTILTALPNSTFNLENTGVAGFAELCLCTREETSPGGRFKGSLVGAETL